MPPRALVLCLKHYPLDDYNASVTEFFIYSRSGSGSNEELPYLCFDTDDSGNLTVCIKDLLWVSMCCQKARAERKQNMHGN